MNNSDRNFASLDDAFQFIVRSVLEVGELVAPRAVSTAEVRAISITIADPRRRYISLSPRRWSFPYALGEFAWHLRASDKLDEIEFYSPRWRGMSENGVTVDGSCYGAKIFRERHGNASQWKVVKELLAADPASRRAVLLFAQSLDRRLSAGFDVSCATSLQFVIRNGKLEAIGSMRSNDAILGLPYDIFLFTMLQEMMAVELGLDMGAYHHFVGSMHIYATDMDLAKKILSANPQISEPMPAMPSLREVPDFLEGERQTRISEAAGRSSVQSSGYWADLISVLRYRNESRIEERTVEDVIANPLYRRLTMLRQSRTAEAGC